MKERYKTCGRCKGNGYTYKIFSHHSLQSSMSMMVICDQPFCNKGVVDLQEYYCQCQNIPGLSQEEVEANKQKVRNMYG